MKSSFQTILVAVFVIAFVGAVLIFSGLLPFGSKKAASTPQGTVQLWGTVPQPLMQNYLDNLDFGSNDYQVSYTQHDPATLAQDIIVALANGAPPDMVIFSSELFNQFRDKLYVIPYAAYSERLYRDTNIDGAQIFLSKDGLLGFPLVVDPLVVYYNKDIIAQANFVVPPKTWTNLQQVAPTLTKKDSRGAITQSAIALGTFTNVDHARDILSALFMQAGNSIVAYDAATDQNRSVLGLASSTESSPVAQTLLFYTSFANPTNGNYSWNNALPRSLTQFLAGRSAYYIGRASELFTIQAQNPNLNFDVTQLFQTGASARPVTFGSFLAIGILKSAPNLTAAYPAANTIASTAGVDAFSKVFSLPPVRRDLLQVQQTNPYVSVFFNAALTTFAWPDPNPTRTTSAFRTMVQDVSSGKVDAVSAIFEAGKALE